jgi:hypothetical protein
MNIWSAKPDLAARLLAVVELGGGVFGVDQGQDGVQQVLLGDFLVHEKGLRHRAGIGQARGFDHHAVEVEQALALLGGQQLQGFAQILADRAADAAVVHLDDVFLGVVDQDLVVDVFLAEFILDDGDLLAVRFGQHALEQRGLAGAQKAGEDGDGNQAHGVYLKTGKLREWQEGGGPREPQAGEFSGGFKPLEGAR